MGSSTLGSGWITIPTVVTFLLILSRIGGLFFTAPMFNNQGVPIQAKVGIAFSIALAMFSVHSHDKGYSAPTDMIEFSVMAGQEVLIGILIGFAVSIVLAGVQMCGDLISTQQGLSVANVLDPLTHTQVPAIGQFYYFMAVMLFLTLNMHHGLIMALSKSFEWLPLGHTFLHPGHLAERFILISSNMYVIGLMMGIPVFAVLMVTEVAMAFTTKVMPQMNIFMVALPFKITLGFVMIIISLPASSQYLTQQYDTLLKQLMILYRG